MYLPKPSVKDLKLCHSVEQIKFERQTVISAESQKKHLEFIAAFPMADRVKAIEQ